MAKLESYSNLSKLQEDLQKKNFSLGQDLALSLYARASSLVFKSSFKQKTDSSDKASSFGSTYFHYKGSALTVKQELGSNSLSKTTAEYVPETAPRWKGKLEIESNANEKLQKSTVSAEYSNEKSKNKVALVDDLTLKVSNVFAVNNYFGTGVDLAFDVNEFRFVGYNAALWLYKDDYRFVLKHVSTDKKKYSLGNLVASLYVNKFKDITLGAAANYTVKNGEFSVQGAAQKKLDENTLVKGRVDLKGDIGFALRNKISESVTVVSATEFNVFDATRSLKFGMRLKFNQ